LTVYTYLHGALVKTVNVTDSHQGVALTFIPGESDMAVLVKG
jgi:hypothetical protein